MVACSMGALVVLTGLVRELGLEAGEVDFPPYEYSEGWSMRPSLISARQDPVARRPGGGSGILGLWLVRVPSAKLTIAQK